MSFVSAVQEMQKSINSYKCLMISINLSSRHFLRGDSAELQELREALASANHSWTQACGGLESWERRLHCALLQCQVRRREQTPSSCVTFQIKTRVLLFFRSSTGRFTLCCCGCLRPRADAAPWSSATRLRLATSCWSTGTRWR